MDALECRTAVYNSNLFIIFIFTSIICSQNQFTTSANSFLMSAYVIKRKKIILDNSPLCHKSFFFYVNILRILLFLCSCFLLTCFETKKEKIMVADSHPYYKAHFTRCSILGHDINEYNQIMVGISLIKRGCTKPFPFCYSEEAEDTAMVVDDIPDDILDQDDNEVGPMLPQPIVPKEALPPTTMTSGQLSSNGQKQMAELLADFLPPLERQPQPSPSTGLPPAPAAHLPVSAAHLPVSAAHLPVSAATPTASATLPVSSTQMPILTSQLPPPPSYPPPLMQSHTRPPQNRVSTQRPNQQRAQNQRRNARQRHNFNRSSNFHQSKNPHRGGLHGVRRGALKRSNQQELNQRNLKHSIENMLADVLQVKPSNPSTLELLVSELKPL